MVFFVDKWFCLNKVSLDCEVEVPELDVKGVKRRGRGTWLYLRTRTKGTLKKVIHRREIQTVMLIVV